MPRKPYIPLEIDFILGDDQHFFPEVSATGQKLYLASFCWVWKYTTADTLDEKRLLSVRKRVNIDRRRGHDAVKELTNRGLFKVIGDNPKVYKIIGLQNKRQKAFKLPTNENLPKGSNKVPQTKPKPNQKETKLNPNQTKGKDSDDMASEKISSGSETSTPETSLDERVTVVKFIISKYPDAFKAEFHEQKYALAERVASVKGLVWNTQQALAYCLDAQRKKKPVPWLITALVERRYNPTDGSMKTAKVILEKKDTA